MISRLLSWIGDILISVVLAAVIIVIVNELVSFGLEQGLFGSWSLGLSQLWPTIMMPVGILIAILFVLKFAPRY